MPDFTLPPASTLVVGMTGSGKTTFAIRYLINAQVACRFVFDDLGRVATRLKIKPAYTARELELALQTRWVVFNPHKMFPGETEQAFWFFCQWVYDVCSRGPGKKLVLADEIWQWVSPHNMPRELALVCQTGREENIELICCSQLPHKLHAAITGQATEVIAFRLDERLALERVGELGCDRGKVASLPLGSFIARNRLSGGQLAGKVF